MQRRFRPKQPSSVVQGGQPSELWKFAKPVLMDFAKWLIVVAVVGAARGVAQILVALGWIAAEEMEILRKIHFWAMVALTAELAAALVIKMAVPALEVWKKPNDV